MLFSGTTDVVGGDARDDLASFWLRKTKRPVLAVLLVQKKGEEPQLYRGTNMEVGGEVGGEESQNKLPYASFQMRATIECRLCAAWWATLWYTSRDQKL